MLSGRPRDKRMRLQEFGEAAAQGAGTVAMDDAYRRPMRERRVVQKFVDKFDGLLDSEADYIDLFGADRFGPSRIHCNAWTGRAGEILCSARRWLVDGDDFVAGYFHAQGAGFDFGGGTVQSAKDDGFGEAADADACAGLQHFRADSFRARRCSAEIGLRIGNGLHYGGV